MWMDHRAEKQADFINSSPDSKDTLSYVGGRAFLELDGAKVLWLKQNVTSEVFEDIQHLFDLPDYLTWRATGVSSRSSCSLGCKLWGLLPEHEGKEFGWDIK